MKCKTCNGLGRTKATEFVGVDEGLREVVILCPACGGTGKVVHPMMSMNGDEYTGEWEQHECEACNGTGVVEPLTNEEWRRTCSTEEFAKWLSDTLYACMRCGMNCHVGYCPFDKCIIDKEDALGWLKEIHQ